MRNAFLPVLALLLMFAFGCAQQPPPGPAAAGLTEAQAMALANSSQSCLAAGSLEGTFSHDAGAGTWSFAVQSSRPGCSPVCIVNEADNSTSLDPRCIAAPVPPLVTVSQGGALGNVLVANGGMTLYVFLKDSFNQSNCTGSCAGLWPPLTYSAGDNLSGLPGILGLINRSDGSVQVTYNGMPLYLYSKDKSPGDANGEGFNRLWYAIGPDATAFPSPRMTAQDAEAIAANSTCASFGSLAPGASYDNSTSTWRIGITHAGCTASCIVSVNGSASVQSSCNQSLAPVVKSADFAGIGSVLTDNRSMALYVFLNDQYNSSTCTGYCAQTWPPLLLGPGSMLNSSGLPGSLGTIARVDGTDQVTYNGMPLYTYSGDGQPGLANGNGVGGVWFVATPNMTAFPQPPPPSYGGYGGY